MAFSQMPLLLALLALTSSTSVQPIPIHKGIDAYGLQPVFPIHKVIAQFGFPLGLFPDSVVTYYLSPLEVGFSFIIYLENRCYVTYRPGFEVRFERAITGHISHFHITQLDGLDVSIPDGHGGIAVWAVCDEIKVSTYDETLLFTLFGSQFLTMPIEMELFASIPTCINETLAACDPSTKLISQLPVTTA